jgi:hypothetical protein
MILSFVNLKGIGNLFQCLADVKGVPFVCCSLQNIQNYVFCINGSSMVFASTQKLVIIFKNSYGRF